MDNPIKRFIADKSFTALVLGLILLLTIAYANHFSNSFHFDDFHLIVNNAAIREIQPLDFLTDPYTLSSLNTNQSYRPLTTLENALDYTLGNGLNVNIYRVHIFIVYLGTCLLLFVMVKRLLARWYPSKDIKYYALVCMALYGLCQANAEILNYITQRAEITATFFVLSGFVVFIQSNIWRRTGLYLLFPLLGFLSNETALVFAPLLFVYILLFEKEVYLLRIFQKKELLKTRDAFLVCLPAFLITLGYLIFYSQIAPDAFHFENSARYEHWITQPYLALQYIMAYFWPFGSLLEIDSKSFKTFFDSRIILGFSIISGILFLAFKASKRKETRLLSFGLLWFFISLLPLSMLPNIGTVNYSRPLLPYIGLTIAIISGFGFFIKKYLLQRPRATGLYRITAILLLIFLSFQVYGIRKRNQIWRNELSLWHEMAQKNSKNGNTLMNYGIALMNSRDYENAEKYLEKALAIIPNHPHIHSNLGIVKNVLGDSHGAEEEFKKGISLSPNNYNSLFTYGKYLLANSRYAEAQEQLAKSHELAPTFYPSIELLMEVLHRMENWEALSALCEKLIIERGENKLTSKYLNICNEKKSLLDVLREELDNSPSALNHYRLGKEYYSQNRFAQALYHSQRAVELQKDFSEAFNLLGLSLLKMGNCKNGKVAFKKALEIQPNLREAKRNLLLAMSKEKFFSYTESPPEYLLVLNQGDME
nr:tetratricopeptide repeat protein [Allomuricauda sp.]